MKNNLFDKKLIILFIAMILIIIVMFYFLSAEKKKNLEYLIIEDVQSNELDILEAKEVKIKQFLDGQTEFLNEGLIEFLESLNYYINLPLDIGPVGNEYPFGDPEELE